MTGHIDDMTTVTTVTGENLESALELGEKHESFVSTCKEVRLHVYMYWRVCIHVPLHVLENGRPFERHS